MRRASVMQTLSYDGHVRLPRLYVAVPDTMPPWRGHDTRVFSIMTLRVSSIPHASFMHMGRAYCHASGTSTSDLCPNREATQKLSELKTCEGKRQLTAHADRSPPLSEVAHEAHCARFMRHARVCALEQEATFPDVDRVSGLANAPTYLPG